MPPSASAQQLESAPGSRCYTSTSRQSGAQAKKRSRFGREPAPRANTDQQQQQEVSSWPGRANTEEPVWIYGLINNIEQMLTTMNAAQSATVGSTCRSSMPASPLSSAVPSPPCSSGSSSCSAASPSASNASFTCLAPTSPGSATAAISSLPKSPMSRQIKFHEYKGPPMARRQLTTNSSYQKLVAPKPAYLASSETMRTARPMQAGLPMEPQHSIQPEHAASEPPRKLATLGQSDLADSSAAPMPLGPHRSGAGTPIEQIRLDAMRPPRQTGDERVAGQGQPAASRTSGSTPSLTSPSWSSPASSYRTTHQSSLSATRPDRVQPPTCSLATLEINDALADSDESDITHVCRDLFTMLDLPMPDRQQPPSIDSAQQPVGLAPSTSAESQLDEELLFSEFIDLQDVPMNVTESDWLRKFLPPSCSLSSLTG